MELRQTRKIISALFSLLIALCVALSLFSLCSSATLMNENYAAKHFVTDELVAECDRQLSRKFEALANESRIPARVFETIKENINTRTSLQQGILMYYADEENEYDAYAHADYFYELCTEYLDGNSLKYDKTRIEKTAGKAALIYSETVNINCGDVLRNLVLSQCSLAKKISSASLAGVVISMLLLSLMYKDLMKAYTYMAGAFEAGSAVSFLFCLFIMAAQRYDVTSVYPRAYSDAFASLIKDYLVFTMIISAVLFAVSVFCMIVIKKTGDKRESNSLHKYINGM